MMHSGAVMRRTSLLFLALAACGGTASTDPSPSPSSTEPPPASTPPGDPTHFGGVGLSSSDGTFIGSAGFDQGSGTKLSDGCVLTIGDGQTKATTSKTAGDLAVDIPTSTPRTLTIAYDASKKSYGFAQVDGVDAITKPIRVRAPGTADVPAFDTTVPAAQPITITSPESIVLSKTSDDIVVTWSASDNEDVILQLTVAENGVACRFPAKDQRGVIPKSLVQQAVAKHAESGIACAGTCSLLSVIGMRSTSIVVHDWRFFVSHSTGAVMPATLEP